MGWFSDSSEWRESGSSCSTSDRVVNQGDSSTDVRLRSPIRQSRARASQVVKDTNFSLVLLSLLVRYINLYEVVKSCFSLINSEEEIGKVSAGSVWFTTSESLSRHLFLDLHLDGCYEAFISLSRPCRIVCPQVMICRFVFLSPLRPFLP